MCLYTSLTCVLGNIWIGIQHNLFIYSNKWLCLTVDKKFSQKVHNNARALKLSQSFEKVARKTKSGVVFTLFFKKIAVWLNLVESQRNWGLVITSRF